MAATGSRSSKNAPPEAVDFLKFFVSTDNGNKLNTSGIGMSPVNGTGGSITDPNLKAVLAGRDQAKFIQLYLDQAVPPSVGAVVNDATVALFLGKSDRGHCLQGPDGRGCQPVDRHEGAARAPSRVVHS